MPDSSEDSDFRLGECRERLADRVRRGGRPGRERPGRRPRTFPEAPRAHDARPLTSEGNAGAGGGEASPRGHFSSEAPRSPFPLSTASLAPLQTPSPNPRLGSWPAGRGPFRCAPLRGAQSSPPSPSLPSSLPFCASSAVSLRRAAAAAPW